MVFFIFSVDMSLHLMSFAFQLKNFISISLVQVSWQTILCYFIYWKCPYSTLKFEGYFCWMWNSKLAVVLFVLFVVCLFCLLFCLLFVCFVCFPTFCSLDHSCPFHSWSSLFAICPVLSLGNSLTGSSLHRLNSCLSSFISCYSEISVNHTIQNPPSLWLSHFPVYILCNISTTFVFVSLLFVFLRE